MSDLPRQSKPQWASWLVCLFALMFFAFPLINCGGKETPKADGNTEVTGDGGTQKDDTSPEPSGETTSPDATQETTPDTNEEETTPDNPPVDENPTDNLPADDPPAEVTPEEEPDNQVPDTPPGTGAFKINKLVIEKDLSKSWDLNGDGTKDNQLGKILSAQSTQIQLAAVVIQNNIDNQINNDGLVMLVNLKNLTDPTGQNGTADVQILLGKAGANPGEYTIDPISVDSLGNAYAEFPKVKITNGEAETKPTDIVLFLPLIIGRKPIRIELKKTRLKFKVSPQLRSLQVGLISGAMPIKYLDEDSGLQGTILEVLVQEAPTEGQPDIDLDGDKLETLAVQNMKLTCKDGDQKPVAAPNPCPDGKKTCSCARDPKMADGFSAILSFEAMPTKIVK